MEKRRVVITGLGTVNPLGNNTADSWAAAKAGKCGIGPITQFDTTDFKCKLAGEVKGFDPETIVDKKEARKMARFTLLALGAAAGYLLNLLEVYFHSRSKRMSLSVAFVLLTVGLSMVTFDIGPLHCGFSLLLVCMMTGTVFCNICPLSDDLMDRADKWSTPMLAVFFVVSGANLRLSVFSQGVLVLIGVVYIIARSAGKYCGARWSAKAVGCDHTVQKYLGIMLLPQEGVALGMCVSAQALGADGELIRNIILFSVLIYELVGPLATKESLKAAGAITEKPREVLERRERKLAEAEPKELLERRKERANKK